jgi:cell wall-associated NlpC family hydrolase
MTVMSQKTSQLKYIKISALTVVFLIIAYTVYSNIQTNPVYQESIINSGTSLKEIPASVVEANISLQDSIVDFGERFLGTPYVAAGCSVDGFDCSGFVYFVFQHHHIDVPRSSADFENFGTNIPIEEVQKGDILLFLSPTRDVIGHIGIVSNHKGMESDFIHSSSGRAMQVIITSLTNEGYTKRFVKAIRVI